MNTTTRRPRTIAALLAAPAQDDWRADAECRTEDPDLFFPTGEGPAARAQAEEAKRVCLTRCAVREQCLAWALEQRLDSGVWGGMSEWERQRLHGRRPLVYRGGVQSALHNILQNRLAEFRALEAQGLDAVGIAREMGTNVNTVNRVREALAGPAAEGVAVA